MVGSSSASDPGDLIAAGIYYKYSAGPSIRPIYFTTTYMIRVCSNLHCTRVFILNTQPESRPGSMASDAGDRDPLGEKPHFNLAESVYTVALQKSIPAQIRQLILYLSNEQG